MLFDGRAKRMTQIYSFEDVYGDLSTLHHGQSPAAMWDGLAFLFSNVGRGVQLVTDPRYGKAFKIVCKIGDSGPHQPAGAFLAEDKGSAQISKRRPNDLGKWDYFAIATKVPSWSGDPAACEWFDFLSANYETARGDQLCLRLTHDSASPTGLAYAVECNVGYTSGTTGFQVGDHHWNQHIMPLVFNRWDEWVIGVKQATDNTGEVHFWHRVPGGAWSEVVTKRGVPTYLWGKTTYGTFNQDGTGNPGFITVIDKIGLYYGHYPAGTIQTAYESGLVRASSLAEAQATFPA